MKRKVVLHGPSTLTVSLPTEWVKKYEVKKGQELDIAAYNDVLQIRLDKGQAQKSISIDVRRFSPDIIKSILAVLHKSGYDEIEIAYDKAKTLALIEERISSMLMGYELIVKEKKRCLIRAIANDDAQEFHHVLRRTFLVTLELAQKSCMALKSQSREQMEKALELEQVNNRLTNFCHRILNKGTIPNGKTTYYYTIVWLLEKIGDEYKQLLQYMEKNPGIRLGKEMLEHGEKVNKLFEAYYVLFYRYSNDGMDALRRQHKQTEEALHRMLQKKSGTDAIMGFFLCDIAQRIYDCFGSTTALQY
ncbi:hypothetical protein HYS48_03835 [Candidatus Woesearchaeota archaeon]|nr:hypothetical protein [Candidatus Woesearchaeota archaeon]